MTVAKKKSKTTTADKVTTASVDKSGQPQRNVRKKASKKKIKAKGNPGTMQNRFAGVGWKNENDTISIQLEMGVVLDWQLSKAATIILVPMEEK